MEKQQVSQGSPACLSSVHVPSSLLPGIWSYRFIPQTHSRHYHMSCVLLDTKE